MATEYEIAKAAGFSDEEFNAWATEERARAKNAGFSDNEIDAFFANTPVVPERVPRAFLERLYQGDVWKRTVETFAAGKEGFGDERLGLSDENIRKAQELGIFRNPVTGKGGSLFLETMVRGSATAWDVLARGIRGGVHMIAEHVGQLAEESDLATKQKAKNETINFLNWQMQRGDIQFGRFSHGPEGPVPEKIGAKPTAADVHNSAVAAVGDGSSPKAVQEKLVRSYAEQGIHPAEAANDAAIDPVVAQRLLSKDARDLPYGTGELTLADIGEGYGYQFHPEKPVLPGQVEAFRQSMADLGFEARAADMYFPDITEQKITSVSPINIKVSGIPDELPKLFGDIEIPKAEAIKEKVQPPPREGTLASAEQEVAERISVGERRPERKMSWRRAYAETIDDLHPIKAVSQEAYEMARLTRGQFGKANFFLEHSTFDFNTYKNTGKPLREILKPVRDDLDGLRKYLVSKRAMEVEESGRKTGVDFAAARQVVTENAGKYEKIAGELIDFQKEQLRYLKDSGVISEEAMTAMLEANKAYVPFYRVIEEGLRPKGTGSKFGPVNPIKALEGSERKIIDPIESIIKNTYAYINIAERNAVGITIIDALKKEGMKVEREVAPRVSRSHNIEGNLENYLKDTGVANPDKVAEFIKGVSGDNGMTISAWRNGVRETIKIDDPELAIAFHGLDRQSAGLLTRVLAVPASSLRAGAVLSPDFMARNIIRDLMQAFVTTKGTVFTPIDTAKGFVGIIKKDADFQNWLKAGGANSTLVALDRAYMQESLAKLAGETGLFNRAYNIVAHPLGSSLRPLRMISELMENATRLGEFKKLAGASKEAMQSAAYASREVTLDFARAGARMRSYNMITAFANAQIQGLDRTARAFNKQDVAKTTLRIAGGVTLPSILLWWANHGDPRYEELAAWQKDLFWIILTDKWEPIDPVDAAGKPEHLLRTQNGRLEFNNGSIWRIPKPHELGVIFGSGAERILSATIGKSEDAFSHFGKSVMNILVPNYMPTAVQPVLEQWGNRSYFTDRTIIPADVEKHLPEYQYTPYTTELSRKLGQLVASFPGIREASVDPGSPAKPLTTAVTTPVLIENYVRAWTGGLGMYVLEGADAALRKAGVLPDPVKPTATLADIPFIKAFVIRYPSATTQSIQDFHDGHARAQKFFNTYMARAEEGDAEAMKRIEDAGGIDVMVQLDDFKEALGEHAKLIRDIYKNPDIPADEKRQLIDGYYYSMIEIGKAGREMQRAIKE